MMGEEHGPASLVLEGKRDGRIKPGEVKNPTGRNQWDYRRKFEQSFAVAVEAGTETLISVLISMAKSGDKDMMRMVMERIMPKIERHELDAGAAVSKMVIEFAKPEKETDSGDAG